MKITETKIKVSDLVENYSDNGDGGVYGYNNRLTVRSSSTTRISRCGTRGTIIRKCGSDTF